jgi:hypothetical protein
MSEERLETLEVSIQDELTELNAALAPIVFVFDETDKHGGLIQFEALERAAAALRAYRDLEGK